MSDVIGSCAGASGPAVQILFENGPFYLGAYNPATTYNTGDVVSYNGSSYVALGVTTGNLPTNTSFWQLLASQGATGPQGDSFEESFETVSKNLKSWDYTLNYTSGILTSIIYTNLSNTITKTLNYSSGLLTSIVLSGDTPSGISLTKTLNYTSGVLTSITYT